MSQSVTFHDYKPKQLSLYEAVVDGFSQPTKSIAPKFFYDEKGSQLFTQICEQPEYYLPEVEKTLLMQNADEIAELVGKDRILLEPGAGNLYKVRLLLDALQPSAYVPMDISGEYLQWASEQLAQDFSWLPIHAACVDFTHSLPIPDSVSNASRLAFFPGSSLGNFHRQEAINFLNMVRNAIGPDGMLLIGVDTKKNPAILNAAYNDEAGITAEFNLNLLWRIRRELEAECNPYQFAHQAFYNESLGRIEMHLVSQQQQSVQVNGHHFDFQPGETVHTECSYKYYPEEFIALANQAGLSLVKHWLAERDMFAVYLLTAN